MKMAKEMKFSISIIFNKAFAYLKHLTLCAFGLKWESYLDCEMQSWEKWCAPSLYTWKKRFEANGYRINLDEKQISSKNYINWDDLQNQLDINYSKNNILIAEIGSGPAGIGYTINGKNVKVICMDPLLNEYRRMVFYKENVFDRVKDKFICIGVAESVPLRCGVLDIAFSINVLDHCKDPEKALEEIWRVLKDGGILILDVDVWIGRKPLVIDAHPSRLAHNDLEKIICKHFRVVSAKLIYKQFGYGSAINRILLSSQNILHPRTSKFGEAFYILKKDTRYTSGRAEL